MVFKWFWLLLLYIEIRIINSFFEKKPPIPHAPGRGQLNHDSDFAMYNHILN
jgi:hypothetical protein